MVGDVPSDQILLSEMSLEEPVLVHTKPTDEIRKGFHGVSVNMTALTEYKANGSVPPIAEYSNVIWVCDSTGLANTNDLGACILTTNLQESELMVPS